MLSKPLSQYHNPLYDLFNSRSSILDNNSIDNIIDNMFSYKYNCAEYFKYTEVLILREKNNCHRFTIINRVKLFASDNLSFKVSISVH